MMPATQTAGMPAWAPAHRFTTEEATMFDATTTMGPPAAYAGTPTRRRAKPVEYRIYFGIVFTVALPIALITRMLPRKQTFLDARPARRGVFGEARALTNTVIPFLFMG